MVSAPAIGLTLSTSALLALQGMVDVEQVSHHLRVRPRLVRVVGERVGASAAEREALAQAGLLTAAGAVDENVAAVVTALSEADAEVNVTLVAADRAETRLVVARQHRLVVVAARCAEEVVIDAWAAMSLDGIAEQITATIDAVVGAQLGEQCAGSFEGSTFGVGDVRAAMSDSPVEQWQPRLRAAGVPAPVAALLQRCETDLVARAEVSTHVNQFGGVLPGDVVMRATATPAEAVLTSVSTPGRGPALLTVEPYSLTDVNRLVVNVMRSVPGKGWDRHSRCD